jgi:hypothetical protein
VRRYAIEASGGCQCGAVRYHATAAMDNAHICHCRMCQKAVGNLFEALVGVPKDALTWTRGAPAAFRSSANVERGFCANCGTPLFYNDVTSARIAITIGSFDHPELFPPISQDGIEGRLPYFNALHAIEKQTTTEQDSETWAAAIKATSHQHPDHDTADWPPQGGARG